MAADLLGTLFKAMSGLQAFTKGLDNLSNNVANLNTTGYKANDVFYSELEGNQQFGASGDDGSQMSFGQGVAVGGTKIRFADGELAETGNDTDIAIEGNGYFVLRDGEEEFYTRAGEFLLDEDGYLVDPGTALRVAKISANGELADINLRDKLVSPAEASDRVRLRGVLNKSATEGTVYPSSDATDVDQVEMVVYDDQGQSFTFYASFTKGAGSDWLVDFVDANGARVAESVSIDFTASGAPTSDSLSKIIDLNLFDLVDADLVSERFRGVDEITIDNPGDLDEFGQIDIELSEGAFVTRPRGDGGDLHFQQSLAFRIDEDGFLVDATSGRRLAARDLANPGQITDAMIELQNSQLATRQVTLSGVLDALAPIGEAYPEEGGSDQINVTLRDEQAGEHIVSLSFIRVINGADSAEYEVIFNRGESDEFNASGNIVYQRSENGDWELVSDELTAVFNGFDDDGNSFRIDFDLELDDPFSPLRVETGVSSSVQATAESGETIGLVTALEIQDNGQVVVSYSNGEVQNGPLLAVVDPQGNGLRGLEMDFSAVSTAEFTSSNMTVEDITGRGTGQLSSFSIEEDGTILLQYSNGDEVEDDRIALALFNNEGALQRSGSAMFTIAEGDQRVLGSGEDGAFGKLIHRSIERSNVELSREFAEIIIVQRGFQAASQVLNATNELIEELYNSTRGGR